MCNKQLVTIIKSLNSIGRSYKNVGIIPPVLNENLSCRKQMVNEVEKFGKFIKNIDINNRVK